jgi:hypothetical protein
MDSKKFHCLDFRLKLSTKIVKLKNKNLNFLKTMDDSQNVR